MIHLIWHIASMHLPNKNGLARMEYSGERDLLKSCIIGWHSNVNKKKVKVLMTKEKNKWRRKMKKKIQ